MIFVHSYLAQNCPKQIQHQTKIDFNNLIAVDNDINVIEESVVNVPTFVQITNTSQQLESTMKLTDAIVIENDGNSTLPLSNF